MAVRGIVRLSAGDRPAASAPKSVEAGNLWNHAPLVNDEVGEGALSEWPDPTIEMPTRRDLEHNLLWHGSCLATDGCVVAWDDICPHGHPSWWLRCELPRSELLADVGMHGCAIEPVEVFEPSRLTAL
jgi:hypothetical protein